MNIINVYDIISSTHFLGFDSEMELTVLDTTGGVCDLNSWGSRGARGGVGVNWGLLPSSFVLCHRFRVKNGGLFLTFSAIIYYT